MQIVKIHEAKTHLSRLIKEVLNGEEIIISKGNNPLVKLVALKNKDFEMLPTEYLLVFSEKSSKWQPRFIKLIETSLKKKYPSFSEDEAKSYEDDFKKIQNRFKNFKYYIALSEPLPEDNWKGDTGFINQVLYDNYLKDHPAPEDCEYYMCGPPLMNSAMTDMLENLGVEEESILFGESLPSGIVIHN